MLTLQEHLATQKIDNTSKTLKKKSFKIYWLLLMLIFGTVIIYLSLKTEDMHNFMITDDDAIINEDSDVNQNDDVFKFIYPTKTLGLKFNFSNYLPFEDIGGLKYFLDRALALYPGNEGPILDLLYNKLILNKSTCLNIAILGGSVSQGAMFDYNLHHNTVEESKRYSYYLEYWLNEIFYNNKCKHKTHVIGFGGITIETIIGSVFSALFLSPNSIKYDIIIIESATNNWVKRDNIKEIFEKSKSYEIYFRHFLQIPYHPIIINLECTIHRGAFGHILSSHFIMSGILKYYQIVSLSLYDSLIILQRMYNINHKNKQLINQGYFSYEGTHPFFWGHQLISTVISYYLLTQYNKLIEKCNGNGNINITNWISKHYLYLNEKLPYPPLYISSDDINKYQLLNYVNDIHIFYSFDLKTINYKYDSNNESNNKIMESQINEYLTHIPITNVQNIPFYFNETGSIINGWHFDVESFYKKPGIINCNNNDVLMIKLDLIDYVEIKHISNKVDNNQLTKNCHLNIDYLQSYQLMSSVTYLWISDHYNIINKFECTRNFIETMYNNTKVSLVNALNTNDRTSQIFKSNSIDLINPIQSYPIQYFMLCIADKNKFKLTALSVQCNVVM